MPIRVEVVAAERQILDEEFDEVLARTPGGQIGILPRHAPLLTTLVPGEVLLRRGGEDTILAVGGGFMEVDHNHVVILADSAERAEEIDVARAEEARRRALERLASRAPEIDQERAQAALARALARLRAVERLHRSGRRPQRPLPAGVSETGLPPQGA